MPTTPTFECTDMGNAQRLELAHKDILRFSAGGGWYTWTGKHWTRDKAAAHHLCNHVFELIRIEANALAGEVDEEDERGNAHIDNLMKWAKSSQNAAKMAAARTTLSQFPSMQIHPDDFDPDHHLINLQTGILDLDHSELTPHNPNSLMSNVSRGTWDADLIRPWEPADSPRFDRFLHEIFDGNTGMMQSIQQAFGYTLSGYGSERCIMICHGSGANGKSTLLNLVKHIMGDYAVSCATETLMVKRRGSAGVGDDLAALVGRRMVLASEAEGGSKLAESLVKRMTGGDAIACRRLYHDWFEFVPRFKIWLATNHKPELMNTEPAIRARIRIIPFTISIPRERQTPTEILDAELQAESRGVLRWIATGYREWLDQGRKISWCKEVMDASQEYFEEQDIMGQFINDRCMRELGSRTAVKIIYENYRLWMIEQGQQPLGIKRFSPAFGGRPGITKVKSHGIMFYEGIVPYAGSEGYSSRSYAGNGDKF